MKEDEWLMVYEKCGLSVFQKFSIYKLVVLLCLH